jgi:hypothetical protein
MEYLEKESQDANNEAVEKVKKDLLTQEEADKVASIFFEDDAEIKLRDGKTYIIPPCSLKNARKLMKYMQTVNVDLVMMNFVPSDNEAADEKKQNDLIEIIKMALINYPDMTKEYIEEYVDVEIARVIVEIMIGINGLKK